MEILRCISHIRSVAVVTGDTKSTKLKMESASARYATMTSKLKIITKTTTKNTKIQADMKFLLLLIFPLLTSCTYNVSMACVQGTNSDVIDDNATPTANVRADVSAPVKLPM